MATGVACRCFYCRAAFAADEIASWTDDSDTALCPHCGIDAVISSQATELPDQLVEELHVAAFGSANQLSAEEWRAASAENQTAGTS